MGHLSLLFNSLTHSLAVLPKQRNECTIIIGSTRNTPSSAHVIVSVFLAKLTTRKNGSFLDAFLWCGCSCHSNYYCLFGSGKRDPLDELVSRRHCDGGNECMCVVPIVFEFWLLLQFLLVRAATKNALLQWRRTMQYKMTKGCSLLCCSNNDFLLYPTPSRATRNTEIWAGKIFFLTTLNGQRWMCFRCLAEMNQKGSYLDC